MSGETGQLQKLTDEQVSARLAAYNAGRIARPATSQLLRENAADRDRRGSPRSIRTRARRALCRRSTPAGVDAAWVQGIAEYGRANLSPRRRPVPVYIAARTPRPPAESSRASSTSFADDTDKLEQCVGAFMRLEQLRDRHHPRPGFAARSDRSRRPARPRERAVRAPRRRAGQRQHRAVEVADRPHPLDRRLGARDARQDQRSRRRRRAIGGRDARSRADRRRPDPRDRGRPFGSRGRRRRRHPRRRPGEPGGQGQPGACRPTSRRSNRSSA